MSEAPQGDSGGLAELELRDHQGGCSVVVRVRPRGRRTALLGVRQGALLMAVTAAAEKGRANAAVIELLAGTVGVAKSAVQLVAGAAHRRKILWVDGRSAKQLRQALAAGLRERAGEC